MLIGSINSIGFQPDEINYLVNVANLLGLTLQNVELFEQLATVQQQWAYTFDSIGDPILVHDHDFRVVRGNQRLGRVLGRETSALVGRLVSDLLTRKNGDYKNCPYCEGAAGEGDFPDPWLPGYFLASNSIFKDSQGRELGTVHVLKDITDRKRAEEKYRTLISNVQEGVFISTPQGRFLDFNDACLRIVGYADREELLGVDIPAMFVNPGDRERLKKLLQEHGAVADFEYEIRRKDGEVRTVMESSIGVRDAAGVVTAFQGFLLDITERKHAEQQIRRRNRELMVLNSISQTLTESMDLTDSLQRSLRQIVELFHLDASSLYLIKDHGLMLRRIASVGLRSEYAKHFAPVSIQPELLQHVKAVHATFLVAQGLPLPQVFRDMHRKEALLSEFVVILWSKDQVIGCLMAGSRTHREFSAADINLLVAVGSQISSAIHRSMLYDETRQAYDNLRRTQEQLLHSEKMAAIGQLISGVAHELNNPLTAILGYGQLLTSTGQVGPQATEYADKLLKQAQRTHRIVQNLLSFARQHKPERMSVQLNQVLEDTLALRDYDLRMNNIRVHLNLAPDLPVAFADPHQLQQVFLNLVNNAVDAILENAPDGDLWVRTGASDGRVFAEFKDNGPGVQDSSRVFDPFYTTKPVGMGTGLGLSICYGIITEHGGTISVRNVQPRGACFTIELPCRPPDASREIGGTRSEGFSRAGSILLIDQDESVLEAVGEILRGRNHKVHSASTLSQAKSLLENQHFDLIVSDIEMLGKTDLHHWLHADNASLPQKVVFTTASASAGEIKEAMQSGSAVLQKPFKAADLLVLVEEALAQISVVQ
jgi:two-component system NtrC family sensor kinase